MADKLTGEKRPRGRPRKNPPKDMNGGGASPAEMAEEKTAAGIGDNSIKDPEALRDGFERLDQLRTDFDSVRGAYMADCKNELEKMANRTGASRSMLRKEYKRVSDEQKREAEEKAMEPGQRRKLTSLREAIGTFIDLPLGVAAQSREAAGAQAGA